MSWVDKGLAVKGMQPAGHASKAYKREKLLTAYDLLLTSRLYPSIAALAPVKLGDCFEKIFSFKIRPKCLGYIHLGIAQLPK
jgi:hypothetical protein